MPYTKVITVTPTLYATSVQTISFSAVADAGTFKLTYGGESTTALNYNASAGTIQTAIRLLTGLGSVTVAGTTATTIAVTFTGVQDATALTLTANTLTSSLVAVTATVVETFATVAYSSGDQLGLIAPITGALNTAGGSSKLISLVVIDKNDQTAAQMEVLFWSQSITLATDNAAVSISDADSLYCLGKITIAATDWEDVGANKIATKYALGLPLRSTSIPSSQNIYVSLITKGTPTYTESNPIVLKFGIEYP